MSEANRAVRRRVEECRAIIFDVDGTLAETEEAHREAFNATFAHFRLNWTWDRKLYGELLKITGGKERIRHFVATKGCDSIPDSVIVDIHSFKTARYAEMVSTHPCPVRPGVEHLIGSAQDRGQKIALATTTTLANVEVLLKGALGAKAMNIFDAVVAGDDVARKKPAPDVYNKVLAMLNLDASECVAIEDSYNGVASARSAGISVIVTPSIYTQTDDFSGAFAVVPNLGSI